MILTGRVWKLDRNVGATDLLPARYDKQGMSRQWQDCAKHILEDARPGLAERVRPGDIVVAGEGFGAGHAHYYSAAVMGCRTAGVAAFLVDGIGGLFQRACIDFGMPAWAMSGISTFVSEHDELSIDLATGDATNLSTGAVTRFEPVAPLILDILGAGGSEPWALRRVGAGAAA
ncbi:hypothetical protein [Sphingomonas sp.]|uniref:hypothetical protein n=1 Tax=Sphingomonas sp. TaxID=28214 RepID=UPI003AFFC80B